MKRADTLVKLVPVNLIFSALTLIYFYNHMPTVSPRYFLAESILVSLLILIGNFFYVYSAKQKVDLYFFLLLTVTTWILLLLLGPYRISHRLSRLLMGIAPVLLYVFLAHFSSLTQLPSYKKLLTVLCAASTLTIIALQTFIYKLNYTFYFLIFLSLLCIIGLSRKAARQRRPFHKKHQKTLLLALAVAFLPFVLTRTFVPLIQNDVLIRLSHHTVLILPITIGGILIKRSELYLEHDYQLTLYKIVFQLFFAIALAALLYFIMGLTFTNTLIVLLFVSIGAFLYSMLQRQLDEKQLDLIDKTKRTFEKERLDIYQNITYDNYLDSLTDLIVELIRNTIEVDGTLLIWSEDDTPFILHQEGCFEEVTLTTELIKSIYNEEYAIEICGKSFFSFPLVYEDATLGRLTFGSKSNGSHYSELEIEKLKHLSRTLCEILKTTEILNQNQSRYLTLPQVNYDNRFKRQMVIKSDEMRKSLSLYLHDDVLQTVLAVKNLMALLPGSDEEMKAFILTQMSQLNQSLRDQMFELYPSTLSDLSMGQSLNALCEKFRSSPQAPLIKCSFNEEIDVPSTLKFPIFRMTKELVQNAIKHARANVIEIKITYDEKKRHLYISVLDDGVGIAVNALELAKETQHIGLLSLKQELQMLNGDLLIQNKIPQGTQVQFQLPIDEH